MAKVFQILVPDNTLVSRIISCENQVTELFVIDRADKKFVSEYSSELTKPALYILVNRDKRQLYVGETDDSIKRLRNHEAKDFWTEAIVFHSTGDTLSTTEVKWLEATTYAVLKELGYYDLSENKQVPQQPPLKKNQIYTLEPIFEEAKNYICAAGFDIFFRKKEDSAKAPEGQPSKEYHIFSCTRAGSNAKGYMREDGKFVVLAGSELRSGECDSLKPESVAKRQDFVENYCAQANGKIILKANYTFPSPSAAAAMVVGGSSNGWTRWKDAEGRTLDEVYRANSTHKRTKTKIANTTQITGDNDLSEKLKGRSIKLSINGKGPYSKCEFGYRVIEEYLLENPTTTFKELQQLFPHDLVGSWSSWPLLQPDLEFAQRTKEEGRMRYFEGIGGGVFTTSDGIKFMVSNQWDWKNLPALLRVVEEQGMTYEIWK